MCKVGDIIVVRSYKSGGATLSRHSFVVLSDVDGQIEGLPYDLICNVMSSFKTSEQRNRKLAYPGNFPLAPDDVVTNPHNLKSGYLKTDQLYYFQKDCLDYMSIGYMKPEILQMVIDFINSSDFEIQNIIDNLK